MQILSVFVEVFEGWGYRVLYNPDWPGTPEFPASPSPSWILSNTTPALWLGISGEGGEGKMFVHLVGWVVGWLAFIFFFFLVNISFLKYIFLRAVGMEGDGWRLLIFILFSEIYIYLLSVGMCVHMHVYRYPQRSERCIGSLGSGVNPLMWVLTLALC